MYFSKALLASTLAVAATAAPASSSTTSSAPSSSSSGSSSGGGGGGGVTIINNLSEEVQVQNTASTTGNGGSKSLSSGGDSTTETMQTTSDGSGISIKMSTGGSEKSVLQFEYTSEGDKVFWDFSSIDLDENSAFIKGGFSAQPDGGGCSGISCEAGDTNCSQSYQNPDDKNTNSCPGGTSFTVTLG